MRAGKAKGLGIALGAAMALAGGLAYAGVAGAAPQPGIGQVQAEVNTLQEKADSTGQQYDQAVEQLTAARGRLDQVRKQASAAQAQFEQARGLVAQLAAAAYENSGQESAGNLLTSGDPQVVLARGSMLEQLSGSRGAQVKQLLTAAEQLTQAQQYVQRTETGIAALRSQLAARKATLAKLLASKQATLDSLTTQQQTTVTSGSIGSGGSTTVTYTGPTSTQAEQAVAFAYAQLGKPYQWGATGPGSYDCSGLVQAAWASAGVAIPRDTYEQWAGLPHISTSDLEPGDLLYFDGIGHVAMYVGDGYIIDAPQTGETIRRLPLSTSWYSANLVGAARP